MTRLRNAMSRAWAAGRPVRPVLLTLQLVVLLWGGVGQSVAQTPPDSALQGLEDAWTPIATRNGVHFSYIFYARADNANNGVVIRLQNRNDHPVRYRFTVIFRSPTQERTAEARGRLGAGEMKTGEPDGLFWIPFDDGDTISEIGLRGIDIRPTR